MIWFAGPPTDPASKRNMRLPWLLAAIFLSVITVGSPAQEQPGVAQVDSDQDGMSDALEQALLVQFRPTFMVGQQDCSSGPAEFRPGVHKPQPESDNGTIYGQVFPPLPRWARCRRRRSTTTTFGERIAGLMAIRWIRSMFRCSCGPPTAISPPQAGRRCTGTLQRTRTLFVM